MPLRQPVRAEIVMIVQGSVLTCGGPSALAWSSGIARGPESTRTWAEPSQSFSSRSRSNASNPNASVNKVSVALLSSLPDSAREAGP